VPFITAALLSLVEQAGSSVAILCEGLQREELLRSRLTRFEVVRQLKTLGDSMAQMDSDLHGAMPELDWPLWQAMRLRLDGLPGEELDEALWFACESLVPATLLWLRVYRQSQPTLFRG